MLENSTLYEDSTELHHINIYTGLQNTSTNCWKPTFCTWIGIELHHTVTVIHYCKQTPCMRMAVITSHRYTHGLHRELLPIAGKQSVTSPMQSLLSAKRCSIGGGGRRPPIPHPALRDHDVPWRVPRFREIDVAHSAHTLSNRHTHTAKLHLHCYITGHFVVPVPLEQTEPPHPALQDSMTNCSVAITRNYLPPIYPAECG